MSSHKTEAFSRTPPLPSMSHILSLALTFRRLRRVWGVFPMLTAALPVVLNVLYFILNRLTGNHAILSVLLTMLLTLYFCDLVRRFAPSKKAEEESLAKIKNWLPLLMFSGSTVLCRFIGGLLGNSRGISVLLSWSPRISFWAALRLAGGMSLLGLSLVARYVGPSSVVRCSTCPLVADPFTDALRSALSRCRSVDDFLDMIAGPSETPGELINTPFSVRGNYRRFQLPSISCAFSQALISAFIGAFVAYTSVLPFSVVGTRGNSLSKAAIIATCVLCTLIHLVFTAFDGTSHELNPKTYDGNINRISPSSSRRNIYLRLTPLFKTWKALGFSIVVVYFAAMFTIKDGKEELWTLLFASVLTAVLITSYLHALDELIRASLCAPERRLRRLVREVSGDEKMDTCLDAFLFSILHSDVALVKQVVSTPKISGFLDLEGEEKKRNDDAIHAMANTLLYANKDGIFRAPLEEDILRLAILESLGGTHLNESSERHHENINFWVQRVDKVRASGTRSEPHVVPLVRALCAYVGGLGEALTVCSTQMRRHASSVTSSTWQLPPGALVCGEYAIEAAARCLVWNFDNSVRALADWRSTQLSMLVPVVLISACRLSFGIKKFSQIGEGFNNLETLKIMRRERPELLDLFQACSKAALVILQKLKPLVGNQNIRLELEGDCQSWTRDLLANQC